MLRGSSNSLHTSTYLCDPMVQRKKCLYCARIVLLGSLTSVLMRALAANRKLLWPELVISNSRSRQRSPATHLPPSQPIVCETYTGHNPAFIMSSWPDIPCYTYRKNGQEQSTHCPQSRAKRKRSSLVHQATVADVILTPTGEVIEPTDDARADALGKAYKEMLARATVISEQRKAFNRQMRGASVWLDADELKYWSDPHNALYEVKSFWRARGVESDKVRTASFQRRAQLSSSRSSTLVRSGSWYPVCYRETPRFTRM